MVFLGGCGGGGGEQKGCIPGCSFLLNAYLRTLFRFYVSGKTPMSRFYYPKVVEKGQEVKRSGGVQFLRQLLF